MILYTKKEQFKFLRECYENIQRIFTTSFPKHDTNHLLKIAKSFPFLTGLKFDMQDIRESEDKLFENLPLSIKFNGSSDTFKRAKLYVLVAIYNETTKVIQKNKPINLEELFARVQREYNGSLIEVPFIFSGANNEQVLLLNVDSNVETIMKTQRRSIMRKLPDIFQVIFPPKSKSFLSKYSFFEKLPLHEAVIAQNNSSVTSLLASKLVDINKKDKRGNSPLDIAVYKALCGGSVEIVKILIEYGAKVNSSWLNEVIKSDDKNLQRIIFSAEIKKNSMALAESSEDPNSFFHKFPRELNIYIASLTGDPVCQDKKSSLDIATNNFRKP